ncbi:MAG: hypothetical protein RL095_38 [Verrucomicrobiota bacterium]|jgi:hypothetical protein
MSQYISLGYTVTRPVDRKKWGQSILPPQILTLSRWSPSFPNAACLTWTNSSAEEEASLEIRSHTLAQLRDLLDDSFGTKWFWPRCLIDEGLAREILRILLSDSSGWQIFRLYTPAEHRLSIIEELNFMRSPQDPEDSRWLGETPLVDVSQIHALGAEIYNLAGEYTWHVNDLAIEVDNLFGFKVGPWGLLPDLEQARKTAAWITQEGNAEPGLWIPIALCPVDA